MPFLRKLSNEVYIRLLLRYAFACARPPAAFALALFSIFRK